MRSFDQMNTDGDTVCPICGTADQKPVTLIGLPETQEGSICQAFQVHVDCLRLVATREGNDGLRFIIHEEPIKYQVKEERSDERD